MKSLQYSAIAMCIATALVTLAGCASSSDGLRNVGSAIGSKSGRVSVCKSGDTQVKSANQCLQDDAACYEINNGNWCTGERGNSCPAGSEALTAGTPCPQGKRCFRVGESLECTII